MASNPERMARRRAIGAPCPDCGARVRQGAVLCGWCFSWRPGRRTPRTAGTGPPHMSPAAAERRRTPHERRTAAGAIVTVAGLAVILGAARLASAVGGDGTLASAAAAVAGALPTFSAGPAPLEASTVHAVLDSAAGETVAHDSAAVAAAAARSGSRSAAR